MAIQHREISMTGASKALVLETVKNLLTSGQFSDLTIICRADDHKVHKSIVCSRAGFFKRAIKAGTQGSINLDEEEPEVVKRLLQYLYTGEYDPNSRVKTRSGLSNSGVFPHTCRKVHLGIRNCYSELCTHHKCGEDCYMDCDKFICFMCFPPPYEHLLIHSKMYQCAENYDVVGLKDVSKKNFEIACNFAWNQAIFVEAATHAFTTTPDSDKGLRDIIAKTICEHPDLLHEPEIQDLVKESKGLAVGIIERKLHVGWNS